MYFFTSLESSSLTHGSLTSIFFSCQESEVIHIYFNSRIDRKHTVYDLNSFQFCWWGDPGDSSFWGVWLEQREVYCLRASFVAHLCLFWFFDPRKQTSVGLFLVISACWCFRVATFSGTQSRIYKRKARRARKLALYIWTHVIRSYKFRIVPAFQCTEPFNIMWQPP